MPFTLISGGGVAGLEVALLVEDAVVRQEHLPVDALHLAVGEDGERVVDVLGVLGEPTRATMSSDLGGDLVDGAPAGGEEMCLQQQVLRRIAVDGKLGEHDDLGALGAGAAAGDRGSLRRCRRCRRRWC